MHSLFSFLPQGSLQTSPAPQSPSPTTSCRVGPPHLVTLHHFTLPLQYFSHHDTTLCIFFTLRLSPLLQCECHIEIVHLVHCSLPSAWHSGCPINAFNKYLLNKWVSRVRTLDLLMLWSRRSEVSLIKYIGEELRLWNLNTCRFKFWFALASCVTLRKSLDLSVPWFVPL